MACDSDDNPPAGPTSNTTQTTGQTLTPVDATSETSTPTDTQSEEDTSVVEDSVETTTLVDSATDTSVEPDVTPSCAGGEVVFIWGASDAHTVTQTHAPITISALDTDMGGSFDCPDDWFAHQDLVESLDGVPVSVTWDHAKVTGDAWAAYAAAAVGADSIYDFYLNDYGPREDGRFVVTSSTGATLTYNVRYLEPAASINIDQEREAYAFKANWSRNAGPYAEVEGVGQEIHIERMRVRFDGGEWLPWISSEDVTPVRWDPSWVPQGGGPADVEMINTCWPVGYSYHYQSTPWADWEGENATKKTGSIVFDDGDGSEINGINLFGFIPTSMIPAWQSCQVDYRWTFRADLVSNR